MKPSKRSHVKPPRRRPSAGNPEILRTNRQRLLPHSRGHPSAATASAGGRGWRCIWRRRWGPWRWGPLRSDCRRRRRRWRHHQRLRGRQRCRRRRAGTDQRRPREPVPGWLRLRPHLPVRRRHHQHLGSRTHQHPHQSNQGQSVRRNSFPGSFCQAKLCALMPMKIFALFN